MDRSKIIEKIINHEHWLNEDCAGWEKMKADFSGEDLSGFDFCEMNLKHAVFRNSKLKNNSFVDTDLTEAIFEDAIIENSIFNNVSLIKADLKNVYCRNSVFKKTNLSYSNLYHSNLFFSDFSYSYLYFTNLSFANLTGLRFVGANLSSANFEYSILTGSDFLNAKISSTRFNNSDLRWASHVNFIPIACPEEGSFIGYKKARNRIIKLEICEDAKRSSALGRKCRCNKAKVLSITNFDGTPALVSELPSDYDFNFIYKVGEIIEEPNYCENRFNEYSEGIRFFINRQEAIDY